MIFNNQFLRSLVSSYPLAYKIWFYTVRIRKGSTVRLPSKDDNLYFDGYPRSGNTYFVGLMIRLYPEIKYSSHLHTVAGIKIALKKRVPVVIIIRKPSDAIVSNMFRVINSKGLNPNQNIADNLTQNYLNYYSYVLNQRKKIKVLDFNKLIDNERLLMDKVVNYIGLKRYSDENFRVMLIRNEEYMSQQEEIKDDNVSSLPNKKRKEFKKENLKYVYSSPYYSAADKVYKQLAS